MSVRVEATALHVGMGKQGLDITAGGHWEKGPPFHFCMGPKREKVETQFGPDHHSFFW